MSALSFSRNPGVDLTQNTASGLFYFSCLGQAADVWYPLPVPLEPGQELGIWQYVQGSPQAGVGTAVWKRLTIRPVSCERAASTPAMAQMSPFALLTSTCTKKVEVSQTPSLVPERTQD
jgi:hypothetical protein